MITGKFFKPQFDPENDAVVSVFRYTPLRSSRCPEDYLGENPIYVIFKPEIVEFHFQGKLVTNAAENGYLYGNFQLLHLPLKGDQQHILGIYGRNVSLKIDPDYSIDTAETGRYHSINYSALPVFEMTALDWALIDWQKDNCPYKKWFLTKLLLDFLDDFFNGSVFCLSPTYLKIRHALLATPSLKGIYLKADFYLKLQQYKNDSEDRLFRAKYLTALENWNEFIRSNGTNALFTGTKWFDYSDIELQNSLQGLMFHSDSKEQTGSPDNASLKEVEVKENKRYNELIKKTVSQLIREYELFKATSIIVNKTFKLSSFGWLAVFLVLTVLFYLQLAPADDYWKIFVVSFFVATMIGCFFICISLNSFFRSTINLFLPRLAIAICTSWFAILANLDYLKRGFIIAPEEALRYAGPLLLVTCVFLVQKVIQNTSFGTTGRVMRKCLGVIIPGWALSICIGLVGMTFLTRSHLISSDFFDSHNVFRKNVYEFVEHDKVEKKMAEDIEGLKVNLETPGADRDKIACLIDSNYSAKKFHAKTDSLHDHELIFANLGKYHLNDRTFKSQITIQELNKVVYYYHLPSLAESPIILFPGFLILMSSFALFTGIVLTLLLNEKPVSEPI